MIHASERYRFIQEIQDRAFYEEEVVQHLLTEHRAARRSFSEKGSRDPVAAEEIRAQALLAAGSNAPALPIVYAMEEVRGRLSIVYELVQGQPLEELINRGKFAKPRDWADFALRLCDELLEIRRVGGRLERLAIDQIVLTSSNELRLLHRHSVGSVEPARVQMSPYLQRLLVTPSGVYTWRDGEPAEEDELKTLREILVRAACGNTRKTFDALKAEVERSPEMHSTQLASVDRAVADLLVGIRASAFDASPLSTLEHLRDAVASLKREVAYAGQRETQSTVARPADSPAPLVPPFGSSLPEPRIKPLAPALSALAAPAPPPRTPAVPTVEEDANPFLSAAPSGGTVGAAPVPDIAAVVVHHTPPHREVPWLPIVATVAGVAALAAIVLLVVPRLQSPAPNTPPVASIAPPPAAPVRAGDRMLIDASGSRDPEGAELAFHWRYLSPEDGTAMLSDPGSSRATSERAITRRNPVLQVQFLTPGRNTLELRVFDGTFMSDPVQVTVEVTP